MENKITFKMTPLKISLLILLLIVVVFIGFQWIGLRKQKSILVSPQITKEEVPLTMTEEKLKAEEKATTAQAILTAGVGFTPLDSKHLTGFTIQVASFQDKARAELVSEELKKKGYIPVISAKDLGDKGTWYRVWVGDFESEEKAGELLKTLKEDYKDSFIKLAL